MTTMMLTFVDDKSGTSLSQTVEGLCCGWTESFCLVNFVGNFNTNFTTHFNISVTNTNTKCGILCIFAR